MSCKCKSLAVCNNSASQTFAAGATTNIAMYASGGVISGNDILPMTGGYQTQCGGVYRLNADICITGSAAGTITVQALFDGAVIASTVRPVTTVSNSATVVAIDTFITIPNIPNCQRNCCTRNQHLITFQIVSTGTGAGEVTNVSSFMEER